MAGSTSYLTNPLSSNLAFGGYGALNLSKLTLSGSSNQLTQQDNALYWGDSRIGSSAGGDGIHNPVENDVNFNAHHVTNVGSIQLYQGQTLDRSTLLNTAQINGYHLWGFEQNGEDYKLDLKQKPVVNSTTIAFEPSGDNIVLTSNASGQLIWNDNVIGHHEAGSVMNPLQENLDGNNFTVSNVKQLSFVTSDNDNTYVMGSIRNDGGYMYYDSQYHWLRTKEGDLTGTYLQVTPSRVAITRGVENSYSSSRGILSLESRNQANQFGNLDVETNTSTGHMELLFQGNPVQVKTVNSYTTVDGNLNSIVQLNIASDTTGHLKTDVFNNNGGIWEHSCYVKAEGDVVTLSNSLLHTVSNPNDHQLAVEASDSQVHFNASSEVGVTWMTKHEYHSLPLFVPLNLPTGQTLVTPFRTDLTSTTGQDWSALNAVSFSGDALDLSSNSQAQMLGTGGALIQIQPNAPWTLMFWIKMGAQSFGARLFEHYPFNGGGDYFQLTCVYHGGNSLNAEIQNRLQIGGSSIQRSTGISGGASVGGLFDDVWRHYAVRWSGDTSLGNSGFDFVIDGVVNAGRGDQNSTPANNAWTYQTSGYTYINPATVINGSLREMRFYPSKLTVEEIAAVKDATE